MAFDVDAFIDEGLADESTPTVAPDAGALDQSPIDFSATVEADFSDMGGVTYEGDSAFFDAIQRGADNAQASLYATSSAFGSLIGVDGIEEWGLEGFKENLAEAAMNPAQIESFDDIDSLAELGTYIAEAVGENVINMGLMATGGGVGAKMAMAGIGKAATKSIANKSVRKAAATGAFGAGYPLGAGEVAGEFIEEGIDAPGTALLAGIPIAGLDVLGLEKILGVAFKGMPITSAKQLVGQAAKAFGLAAGVEMPTEAAQEMIGMVARSIEDPTFELFTEENFARLKEAGIKGGIAGGVVGGGGATVVGVAKGVNETLEKGRAAVKEAVNPDDAPSTLPEDVTPIVSPEAVTEAFGVSLTGDKTVKDLMATLAERASKGEDIFTEENQAEVDKVFANREITVDDIPTDAKVRTTAVVDGRQVQIEMPAREAVQLVDSEADAYSQLRKCVGS